MFRNKTSLKVYYTHTPHTHYTVGYGIQAWFIPSHCHLLKLAAANKVMPTSKVYISLERVSCRFGSLAPAGQDVVH